VITENNVYPKDTAFINYWSPGGSMS